jgi:hypothetical protein
MVTAYASPSSMPGMAAHCKVIESLDPVKTAPSAGSSKLVAA